MKEKDAYMCPFFKWEKASCLRCEGALLLFREKQQRRDYVYTMCAHIEGWKKCTVAKNLLKMYDRKEQEDGGE